MVKRTSFVWTAFIISFISISAKGGSELLSFDLEDLTQLYIKENAATLTRSSQKETPASVVVITSEQIQSSGARSLDELLETFVPSFSTMYKVQGTQMGMRGIISDRNNKILLLVNGRNMNIKATDGGAITERWSSTLDDIRQVTVISGPGSAVYGPGAIAGIVSIETFDGLTYEGGEVHLRKGWGEKLNSLEFRYGHKFDANSGLFFFYGVDQASGADDDKAPHKIAFDKTVSRPAYNTETVFLANENFPFETVPDGASYQSKPRHKAHIQYDSENLTLWGRYTQSGQAMPPLQNVYFFPYYSFGKEYTHIFQNTGNYHRQGTLYGKYTQALSDTLKVVYSLSYMQSHVEINTLGEMLSGKKWTEKDTVTDIVAHYTPSERHAFAIGASYDYTDFSYIVNSFSENNTDLNRYTKTSEWYSDLYSFYGEYQGKIKESMTLFAGFRLDKHRFTTWMFSPRIALVYMPNTDTTWKLIASQSVRHSDDADLYTIYMKTGKNGDVEKIDHFEVILSHAIGNNHFFDVSVYYNHHNVVAYAKDAAIHKKIGTLDFYGGEILYRYETGDLRLRFSHSYTKQKKFELSDPSLLVQNVSVSPYGYGNDLANWNNHITKLVMDYSLSEKLSCNGSLKIYWGMPGAVDMADYNMDVLGSKTYLPIYSDDKTAFEKSVFLNIGFRYAYNKTTEFSIYGYDLMGLIDEDYNKRNFFLRTSHYRDTAPTLILGMRYQF